jgi:hypothetical protein
MRRTVAFERTASEPEVLDRDMTPIRAGAPQIAKRELETDQTH